MKTLKKLYNKLKASSFWKSVAALSSGQIIAFALNTFSAPILSRIYSKESFGDFAILTSTATLIIGFVGLGLGSTIMAAKSDIESRKNLVNIYAIQVILTLLFCLIIFIISPVYKFSFFLPYSISVIIMFLYISLSILQSLLSVYINRLKMDKVLFFNPLIGALVNIFVKIPLGLLKFNALGMYISTIISLLILNLHMIFKSNPFTEFPRIKEIKLIIKKYKEYIIYQYPASLIGVLSNQMPTQVLSSNYGNIALSDYDMANKMVYVPTNMLATPIQTVYFRTASNLYNEGQNIADFTYLLVKRLLLVGLVPIILLLSFGQEIFSFVLGENWSISGQIASVLSLQYLFLFCNNSITYCRVIINKQKTNLLVSVLQIFFILVSMIIGKKIFGNFMGTIYTYSIFSLIFNVINLILTFRSLKKYTKEITIYSILYSILVLLVAFLLRTIIL